MMMSTNRKAAVYLVGLAAGMFCVSMIEHLDRPGTTHRRRCMGGYVAGVMGQSPLLDGEQAAKQEKEHFEKTFQAWYKSLSSDENVNSKEECLKYLREEMSIVRLGNLRHAIRSVSNSAHFEGFSRQKQENMHKQKFEALVSMMAECFDLAAQHLRSMRKEKIRSIDIMDFITEIQTIQCSLFDMKRGYCLPGDIVEWYDSEGTRSTRVFETRDLTVATEMKPIKPSKVAVSSAPEVRAILDTLFKQTWYWEYRFRTEISKSLDTRSDVKQIITSIPKEQIIQAVKGVVGTCVTDLLTSETHNELTRKVPCKNQQLKDLLYKYIMPFIVVAYEDAKKATYGDDMGPHAGELKNPNLRLNIYDIVTAAIHEQLDTLAPQFEQFHKDNPVMETVILCDELRCLNTTYF